MFFDWFKKLGRKKKKDDQSDSASQEFHHTGVKIDEQGKEEVDVDQVKQTF